MSVSSVSCFQERIIIWPCHCVLYASDRLRSIVPMFGVGHYVETLDAVLEFVTNHQPTTDELVAGIAVRFRTHRVGNRHAAGRVSAAWQGSYGENDHRFRGRWSGYAQQYDMATLPRIMCERMLGFEVCCMRCPLGR